MSFRVCAVGGALALLTICGVSSSEGGDNVVAHFALHRKAPFVSSKTVPTLCDYGPDESYLCPDYTAEGPAPGGSTIFLVAVVRQAGGLLGLSLGIDHDGRPGAANGIDPTFSMWTACVPGTEMTWEGGHGDWPRPESGLRIEFSACAPDPAYSCIGYHHVIGAFYVYAYAEDVFRVVPNRNTEPDELSVVTCDGIETNQLELLEPWNYWEARVGRVHLGGDGSQGIPGCWLCPRVGETTWGRLKTLYH